MLFLVKQYCCLKAGSKSLLRLTVREWSSQLSVTDPNIFYSFLFLVSLGGLKLLDDLRAEKKTGSFVQRKLWIILCSIGA